MSKHSIIREKIAKDYKEMFRAPSGRLKHPFVVPGSASYNNTLWDWDSWLTDIALHQIATDHPEDDIDIKTYGRGCILNFLDASDNGCIPIAIMPDAPDDLPFMKLSIHKNMQKPVLAQHAAFLVKQQHGDASWLEDRIQYLLIFLNTYRNHYKHISGLYYWKDDFAIGVDNDPCTFYRPAGSSGSIYLNTLMYKEMQAAGYLCRCLNIDEVALEYENEAESIKTAIQTHCWDERDGFFYNVDLNLLPIDHNTWLHSGQPRDWNCLIQRIGVWSGFLPLWAGIATKKQAERVMREHALNVKTFNAPYGIRSLSKMEKMYNLRATGNPSNWLGPIWGIVNYFVFRGMVRYGFIEEAKQLADKTVDLFADDLQKTGVLHEYYQPENGAPIMNPGFQNWNYLVENMMAWLDGLPVIEEF